MHSLISQSILNDTDNFYGKVVELKYMGTSIEAILDPQNRYVIRRVISSDPNVYLNPKLSPGTQISFGD